ncbi:MAG: hypothetical protein CV045_07925 [Cyanobacteria bacterium M5B4]|nr:MAG: hypothetical protein CV045_07925 [Cyanobacteria bacterium M5B4]
MIDRSKLVTKYGNYAIARQGAVSDFVLMGIATEYETNFSRKMISLDSQQLQRRFVTNELILETTKFDGEGVFVFFDQEQCFTFNAPSGRVRVGLPCLEKLQQHLLKQNILKALLRCELYYPHPIGGRRAGIADVIRISFSGSAEEIAQLQLVILDIIMLDGKDLRHNHSDFGKTWQLLESLFGFDQSQSFFRPEGSIIPEQQVPLVFLNKTQNGAEGLVIYRLQRSEVYKVKPKLSLDSAVIGYVEGEYEGQYGVTSLLVAMTYGSDHTIFQTLLRIGSGLNDQQRSDLLLLFSQIKVDSPLAMTDNDGRPVSFIQPRYIAELTCEDIMINRPGTDRGNYTQTFRWTGNNYEFLGLHPCPRPTFATFYRLREDKEISNGGARLEQILPNPQPPTVQRTTNDRTEVIRREVYQKGEMIRKLVIVKVEREEAIPYVIYWTDFSAKRKDPLDVKVAYAYNPDRAMLIADNLIKTNILKGWKQI